MDALINQAEILGVIEVGLYEDSFGYLTLNAYAPKNKPQESVGDSQSPKKGLIFNPTPRKRRNTKYRLRYNFFLSFEKKCIFVDLKDQVA